MEVYQIISCIFVFVFFKSSSLAAHTLLGHTSSCPKELLPSIQKEKHSPLVQLSAFFCALYQLGHSRQTDFLLGTYTPYQRHLYAAQDLLMRQTGLEIHD